MFSFKYLHLNLNVEWSIVDNYYLEKEVKIGEGECKYQIEGI